MTRSLIRRLGAALIGLAAALALVAGAQAGGWSVVVLDSGSVLSDAAGAVVAGAPVAFGFTVLQHGRTPLDGLAPRIVATSKADGAIVSALARPDGGAGHYIAELSLPSAGSWGWRIEAFGAPAEMAPISVAAPAPTAEPAAVRMPALAPWAALALVGALGVLVVRARRRPAVA